MISNSGQSNNYIAKITLEQNPQGQLGKKLPNKTKMDEA